ncbi:hypothetical protein PhCBS80983_g01361 [Powellomyces hirtus]|uniref:STEEP1 domain-containing protein n=1 Tax=Powellomyces hirtus TaxID=109895 RepID=A0A507EB17_9FUNG|nr:hypothetical protein PhCBS80983_g01361 [Powellomyces hirtus]
MPKIVSSSTVSASSDLATAAEKNLHVYYCQLCGEYVLIIDKRLHKIPRRKTDNAYIITDQRTYKLNMKRGSPTIVKREGGYEKQVGWNCSRCDVPIGYDQGDDSEPYVYILENAVQASSSGEREAGPDGKVRDKRPSALQATADQLIRESKERVRLYG